MCRRQQACMQGYDYLKKTVQRQTQTQSMPQQVIHDSCCSHATPIECRHLCQFISLTSSHSLKQKTNMCGSALPESCLAGISWRQLAGNRGMHARVIKKQSTSATMALINDATSQQCQVLHVAQQHTICAVPRLHVAMQRWSALRQSWLRRG